MKKLFWKLLLVSCLAWAFTSTAFAAESGTLGTLSWTLDDAGVLTVSGEGPIATDYSTSAPWLDYSSSITSIVLEEGITTVGYNAFNSCWKATSLSLPSTLTEIGDYAFNGCNSISSVTIPDGVTAIGDNAFDGWSDLTSLHIPGSVKSIGSYAFDGGNFTTLTIDEGLESIGWCAFYGCDKLPTVTLPASLTTMGDYVFQYCDALTSVQVAEGSESFTSVDGILYSKDMTTLVICPPAYPSATLVVPDGVTTISSRSMKECVNLTSVTLPDSVVTMGNGVFEDCTVLTSVNIPAGVTVLEDSLFSGCTELAITWDVLDNVTEIGSSVFSGCAKITGELRLPAGVTRIGSYAFSGCTGIVGHVELPAGLTYVDNNLFYGCTGITGVTIPQSITQIGYYAFKGCTGISELELPNSITSIGESAFQGCSSLKEIIIPDSVTSLYQGTFSGCTALTSVTLPRHLSALGSSYSSSITVFEDCSSLTSATFRSAPPSTLAGKEEQLFPVHADGFTIYYPSNAKTEWESGAWGSCYTMECYELSGLLSSGTWGDNLTWSVDADGTMTISGEGEMAKGDYWDGAAWSAEKDFVTKIVVEEGVTTLGSHVFLDFANLTELVLPSGLTTMGDRCVYNCAALEKVYLPETLTVFEEQYSGRTAFETCPNVTLYGYERSQTQLYAAKHELPFISLGVAPVTTVTIDPAAYALPSDVEKALVAALGNHTDIVLKDGVYILQKSLDLSGLLDVTIRAENPGGAEFVLYTGYDPVVKFQSKYESGHTYYPAFIDLKGIIMGHKTGAGFSEGCDGSSYSNGQVVQMANAQYVTVDGCDLWGCGIYAVHMSSSTDVIVKNSVLRDCVYSAVYSNQSQADFINCVISGNAYRENMRSRPCIHVYSASALTFTDCDFYNNYNPALMTQGNGVSEANFTNCTYQDNVWQELTPKLYGVCIGGAVWQVEQDSSGAYHLILHEDITFEDGTVLTSTDAPVPQYSDSSIPWGRLPNNAVITARTFTPGTTVAVTKTEGVRKSTVTIDYKELELETNTPYYFSYAVYDKTGKLVSLGMEQVTFDANYIAEFQLAAQRSGYICRIFLLTPDQLAPQAKAAQLKFM